MNRNELQKNKKQLEKRKTHRRVKTQSLREMQQISKNTTYKKEKQIQKEKCYKRFGKQEVLPAATGNTL